MSLENNDRSIEFVYFDLGNVLLSFDPAVACRNLSNRFSIGVDQARQSVYESGLQDRFERGKVSGQQFAAEIRGQLGKRESEMPTAELLDAVSDMFTPIETMKSVLESVRGRGYGVGLLSNTCHAHWSWIQRQRYSVMEFAFDVAILSFEVGSMKPDRGIYDAAEQAADVPANRILFLDDRSENVAAATERGWNAAQCIGGDPSVDALRSFRVMDG